MEKDTPQKPEHDEKPEHDGIRSGIVRKLELSSDTVDDLPAILAALSDKKLKAEKVVEEAGKVVEETGKKISLLSDEKKEAENEKRTAENVVKETETKINTAMEDYKAHILQNEIQSLRLQSTAVGTSIHFDTKYKHETGASSAKKTGNPKKVRTAISAVMKDLKFNSPHLEGDRMRNVLNVPEDYISKDKGYEYWVASDTTDMDNFETKFKKQLLEKLNITDQNIAAVMTTATISGTINRNNTHHCFTHVFDLP